MAIQNEFVVGRPIHYIKDLNKDSRLIVKDDLIYWRDDEGKLLKAHGLLHLSVYLPRTNTLNGIPFL